MQTFREFVNAGAFQDTGSLGYDAQTFGMGHALNLPSLTLDPPTNVIRSKIRSIQYTENPICICLENGAIWKLTKGQWDYLKDCGREPKEGISVQMELYMDGTIKAIDVVSP
jgi:hypothetical protein